MLEKFITKIKESLPEALQKKLGIQNNNVEDEADEEGDEGTSTEYRYEGFEEDEIIELEENDPPKKSLKSPIKGMKNNSVNDEAEKKKKQTSMLIRVVVILVIGYLALDEFFLKNLPTQENAPSEQAQTYSVDEQAQTPVQEGQEDMPAEEVAEIPVENIETIENSESTDNEAPVAEVNITEAPSDDFSSEPSAETSTTMNEDFSNEISNAIDETNSQETIMVEDSMTSSNQSDFSPDEQTTNYTDLNSTSGSADYTKDLIESKETEEIDKKIVSTPVKTDPPDYEKFGRGLVYNCTDKHWACIDKPSYIQCNNNFDWNKSVGEKPNCFVKAIYTEEEDCIKVQAFYVSNSEPTSECK